MAKKYTVWAFWDNDARFRKIGVCTEKPLRSIQHCFYHRQGNHIIFLESEKDKLDFINKVCWLEPGECKSFEVEVDE